MTARPERPRLLALVTDAFGGRGGIAQYNRDFLTAAAADVDVIVLPRQAPDAPSPPAGVRQMRPPRGRAGFALTALRLASGLGARDVVFCGHVNLGPVAVLAAQAAGAQLMAQAHGIEVWERPSRWRRWAVDRADLALSVSRFTRARLAAWSRAAPERLAVLPNTVAERFRPAQDAAERDGAARRRADLDASDAHLLLTVGRLAAAERYKGHDRVIAALPALSRALRARTGRPVVYAVAGDGDDRPRLEALAAANGVAEEVRFLGLVPAAQLASLYRAADLFVMPSTGEGFGIAFLEAMACGTPALGFAAGGAADALLEGELGLLARPETLGDALLSALAAPPDAVRRGSALSAAVTAHFGRPAFERRVRAVLARLRAPEAAA